MKRILICILFLILGGCATTALYGQKFESVNNNIYTLKIAYGGPLYLTEEDVDEEARKIVDREANKFIVNNVQYSTYEVLGYKRNSISRNIIYTVEFK